MDVILIWADLVGPRPVIQIRAGGEFVESSIPDDGAGQSGPSEGLNQSKLEHFEIQFQYQKTYIYVQKKTIEFSFQVSQRPRQQCRRKPWGMLVEKGNSCRGKAGIGFILSMDHSLVEQKEGSTR